MGPVESAHEPLAPSPEPTPFTTLLDSFVDIPASLRDAHHFRTPTVLSSGLPDPVLGTATPPVKLSPLLNYLHQHLTPHLRSHIGTSIQSCFVTLIIGPSTDPRVGAALHSHLVCAAVAPSNEDYSVLFIPSDLLSDFVCPIEWQPLFLYIAASLAYPDLPFLVTTPDYMAGALCTAQGLRRLLHNSCSHILLATADTLISPHLFLHLPPHVPLSPDAMDTGTASTSLHPFRFRTPDEVSLLVQSTFSDQLSHAVASRASVTEVDLQDAHFSPFTVHHTTVIHQPPRWTCKLKYSSCLTISCPPSPCCPVRWKMTPYLPHPIYFRFWPRCTPIYYTSALEKVASSAHSLTPTIPTNRSPAGSIVLGGRLPQHSPSF